MWEYLGGPGDGERPALAEIVLDIDDYECHFCGLGIHNFL